MEMNGGESLLRTLLAGGIEVCFTTPHVAGTGFAASLQRVPEIRAVAVIDEWIATGAANGYARMAERPVATLLFPGPGLALGEANLRNAASAHLPIVNLVGDPARERRRRERGSAPAIEEMVRGYSGWLRVSAGPRDLGRDAADAVLAARTAPGYVASLIVPEEALASEVGRPAAVFNPPRAPMPEAATIARVAAVLQRGEPAAILLGAVASCTAALITAGRIAAATGASLLVPAEVRRIRRGAGLAAIERIPPGPGATRRCLRRFRVLVLAGVPAPPLGPADLPVNEAKAAEIITLAAPEEDAASALEALAVALSAHATAPSVEVERRPPPTRGPITGAGLAAVIGSLLPESAVVADEAGPAGREIFRECRGAPPHDWVVGMGEPAGLGVALAAGAAMACPDRPVLCLTGEAGAAPAMQALGSMVREGRSVTVLVLSDRGKTVPGTPASEGAPPAPAASDLERDQIALAEEMGVPGQRIETLEALAEALRGGFASGGPSLIEVPF